MNKIKHVSLLILLSAPTSALYGEERCPVPDFAVSPGIIKEKKADEEAIETAITGCTKRYPGSCPILVLKIGVKNYEVLCSSPSPAEKENK